MIIIKSIDNKFLGGILIMKEIKAFECESCGYQFFNKDSLNKCKKCEKEICVTCGFNGECTDCAEEPKAKIYKMEMYILDINNSYEDIDEIIVESERGAREANFHPFNVEEVEVEWTDDIDLNFSSATEETYRKYFPRMR
jgi:hypothetical protein